MLDGTARRVRRPPARGPWTRDDRGAAVVDFVMMSVLLILLLFAVLQAAVYFYARNVAAASAADAARYAAVQGVDPRAGAGRAESLIHDGLDEQDASAISCTSGPARDRPSGLTVTTVYCRGHVRLFFSPLKLPLTVDDLLGAARGNAVSVRSRLTAIGESDSDSGSAIIEFVFVAVVIMVPLMYLIGSVAQVQRNQLAVTQAARDAGRAYATSDGAGQADARVRAAVRLALTDQGLPDDATVRFVASGDGCDASAISPRLVAGAQFAVCVSRHMHLPGVPSVLAGRGITTTAEYVVHVDDFRTFDR